jgi:hypothetical protein
MIDLFCIKELLIFFLNKNLLISVVHMFTLSSLLFYSRHSDGIILSSGFSVVVAVVESKSFYASHF